jgi:O-antigen ligase
MSSAGYTSRYSPWPASLFVGAWAAAIAVAPTLTTKLLLAAPAALVCVTWWTLHRPSRWITAFFAAALLLPPLPIPIGDSGPHPSLLFAALGLFAGLLWGCEWRSGTLARAILTLFAILLASVALAAWRSGPEIAGASFARVALFGISVYMFFYTRETTPRLTFVYWIAVASAVFACVDFYFQFPAPAGYGPQFVWLDSGVYRRAQGIFYEASTLGNFCAFFLAMIAVAFTSPRDAAPVTRKWLTLGALVFFAALVLSYSRASLLNVTVALSVLVWRNRARVRWVRIAPLLAAAGFLTWKVFPDFAQIYWMRLSASAEYIFSATEGVLSGRVASWRTLIAWINEHPWTALTGIGYKTLPYSNYIGAPLIADNQYLSLLVETGIVGLAALIWLHIAILRASARASRSADARRAFYGTWMLCFWAGEVVQMLSGDLLTYWRVLPLYFWVLALAVRS